MGSRWGVLTAILMLHTARVSAAPEPAGQPAAPASLPTRFSPVQRSLQQLIGDGYQVINVAVGLTGFGYLLKRDAQYVTCAVQPDRGRPDKFVSECRAMN